MTGLDDMENNVTWKNNLNWKNHRFNYTHPQSIDRTRELTNNIKSSYFALFFQSGECLREASGICGTDSSHWSECSKRDTRFLVGRKIVKIGLSFLQLQETRFESKSQRRVGRI